MIYIIFYAHKTAHQFVVNSTWYAYIRFFFKGTLQFQIVKPTCAVISLIMLGLDKYDNTVYQVFLQTIYNVSFTWALYVLWYSPITLIITIIITIMVTIIIALIIALITQPSLFTNHDCLQFLFHVRLFYVATRTHLAAIHPLKKFFAVKTGNKPNKLFFNFLLITLFLITFIITLDNPDNSRDDISI